MGVVDSVVAGALVSEIRLTYVCDRVTRPKPTSATATASSDTAALGADVEAGLTGAGPAATGAAGPMRSCAVCLENYEAGERVRILPCLHQFHSVCVDKWLTTKAECPTCKYTVK